MGLMRRAAVERLKRASFGKNDMLMSSGCRTVLDVALGTDGDMSDIDAASALAELLSEPDDDMARVDDIEYEDGGEQYLEAADLMAYGSSKLKPLEHFTRDDIYRESMKEYADVAEGYKSELDEANGRIAGICGDFAEALRAICKLIDEVAQK